MRGIVRGIMRGVLNIPLMPQSPCTSRLADINVGDGVFLRKTIIYHAPTTFRSLIGLTTIKIGPHHYQDRGSPLTKRYFVIDEAVICRPQSGTLSRALFEVASRGL